MHRTFNTAGQPCARKRGLVREKAARTAICAGTALAIQTQLVVWTGDETSSLRRKVRLQRSHDCSRTGHQGASHFHFTVVNLRLSQKGGKQVCRKQVR